jgi:hypothetical protein
MTRISQIVDVSFGILCFWLLLFKFGMKLISRGQAHDRQGHCEFRISQSRFRERARYFKIHYRLGTPMLILLLCR